MPRTGIVELRVRYAETDQMGVVYYANYLVWCEIGRTGLIRELGMSYAEIEASGFLLAVSEANIRYHAPARYDERIHVETSISDVRSRTVTFEYSIRNADTDARLVSASTTLVCLDRAGRSVAMPARVRELLTAGA